MDEEIEQGVNYFVDLLRECLLSSSVSFEMNIIKFKNTLTAQLQSKFLHHWYPGSPERGEAYRCLTINNDLDPTLQQACQAAQIAPDLLKCCLPKKMILWIDPGHVSYRIGNERCPIQDLYRNRKRECREIAAVIDPHYRNSTSTSNKENQLPPVIKGLLKPPLNSMANFTSYPFNSDTSNSLSLWTTANNSHLFRPLSSPNTYPISPIRNRALKPIPLSPTNSCIPIRSTHHYHFYRPLSPQSIHNKYSKQCLSTPLPIYNLSDNQEYLNNNAANHNNNNNFSCCLPDDNKFTFKTVAHPPILFSSTPYPMYQPSPIPGYLTSFSRLSQQPWIPINNRPVQQTIYSSNPLLDGIVSRFSPSLIPPFEIFPSTSSPLPYPHKF